MAHVPKEGLSTQARLPSCGVGQGPGPVSATDPVAWGMVSTLLSGQTGAQAGRCLGPLQLPTPGLAVCFDPQPVPRSPLAQLSSEHSPFHPPPRALKPLHRRQRVLSGPAQSAFRKQWSLAEASVNGGVDLNVTGFARPSLLPTSRSKWGSCFKIVYCGKIT